MSTDVRLERSQQLGVLFFCFTVGGNFGVGIFPQDQKLFVVLARRGTIASRLFSPSHLQECQGSVHISLDKSRVVEHFLELHSRTAAVADLQVCETAQISRVEAIESVLLVSEIIFEGGPQNFDSAGWVVCMQMQRSTDGRQIVVLNQGIQRELLIDRIRQCLRLRGIACQRKRQG